MPIVPVKANPIVVRKTLAVVSILVGACICGGVVYSTLRQIFTDPHDSFNYIVLLPVMAAMAVLGVIPIATGFTLYRAMDEGALKFVLGWAAVLGTVEIQVRLASLFPTSLSRQIPDGLFLLVGSFLMILVYLVALRKLLELFGKGKPKFIWLINNFMFGVLAWQLCVLLSGIWREIDRRPPTGRVLGSAFLWLLFQFGPIILPLVGYKLASLWLERARRNAVPPAPVPSADLT